MIEAVDVAPDGFDGVRLLRPRRHRDERGFFVETYNEAALRRAGIRTRFVQDNFSHSAKRGVVRGLHFQIPPVAQAKLIWVVRGAIFDVLVDLRHGSPTFGRHLGTVLRAGEGTQLYVPPGFAHGFCTLEAETDVVYKVSAPYSPQHERGVRWDDPALGISWPVSGAEAVLSPRDREHPTLAELPAYFRIATARPRGRQTVSPAATA
jgi:dTDP-4-dehydrorhamnose 3,5-epimerase